MERAATLPSPNNQTDSDDLLSERKEAGTDEKYCPLESEMVANGNRQPGENVEMLQIRNHTVAADDDNEDSSTVEATATKTNGADNNEDSSTVEVTATKTNGAINYKSKTCNRTCFTQTDFEADEGSKDEPQDATVYVLTANPMPLPRLLIMRSLVVGFCFAWISVAVAVSLLIPIPSDGGGDSVAVNGVNGTRPGNYSLT